MPMPDEKVESRTGLPVVARKWLSPRRKRFWLLIAVLAYTLAGFFLVPAVLERQIVTQLGRNFDRAASVERVEFNPYALSLRVAGLNLQDEDGSRLAGLDELFVNFQLSSLFRWALTFRELRFAGPYLHFERFADGSNRLGRLLASFEANNPPEPDRAEAEDVGLPRLLVQDLQIVDGRVDFTDGVPAGGVQTVVGPVNISVQNLNTLPDRTGTQAVHITFDEDKELSLTGSLSLSPLRAEGRLSGKGTNPHRFNAYLRDFLAVDRVDADMALAFDYRVEETGEGVEVAIDDFAFDIANLRVTAHDPAVDVLTLPRFAIAGGSLRWPAQSVAVASVTLERPEIRAWLRGDGRLSLEELIVARDGEAAAPPGAGGEPAAASWQLTLDELQVAQARLAFSDRSVEPANEVVLEQLDAALSAFSNTPGATMPLDLSGVLAGSGMLAFAGEIGMLPEPRLSGEARLDTLPLALAEPYARRFASIAIDGGTLTVHADVGLQPETGFEAKGNLRVDGLDIADQVAKERLLGWKSLRVKEFVFSQAENSLNSSALVLKEPFGRFHIAEDGSTNVGAILLEHADAADEAPAAETAAEDPAATAAPALEVVLAGITVDKGRLDFSDFSLPLRFATFIEELSGSMSALAMGSERPSRLDFEGKVADYGLARISGSMRVMDPIADTDVTMEFRNLKMSEYTPYSIQFAGRKIKRGNLDVDLGYVIRQGEMKGKNSLLLSDFELGEKVEAPDAVDLPLDLAVALLKKPDGTIDLSLPVTGDVDDPQFDFGSTIAAVLRNVIVKLVSAPFKLLGQLIGVETEDFGTFRFLPGRADLTPPEREQALKIAEALSQRPELAVIVEPPTDPTRDPEALARAQVDAMVAERMGRDVESVRRTVIVDEELQSAVEALFAETLPGADLTALRAQHTAPPPGQPEEQPHFDQVAYIGDLYERIVAEQDISQARIDELAARRGEAIREAILAASELDAARVVLGEPRSAAAGDGDWIPTELRVDAR